MLAACLDDVCSGSSLALFPLLFFCFLSPPVISSDSDNDDFLSLKSSRPQKNSEAKPGKKKQTENTFLSPKETTKSPPKSTQTRVPVTPTTAPPPPRLTPTSVMDYCGSGGVQRSDRKLVASTKRKAVSPTKH